MIDTSLYTVVRGEALLKSKGKEPPSSWIDVWEDGTTHKCSIGTHKQGLSMPRPHAPHKALDAGKWVAIALATDEEAEKRPLLAETWYHGTSNVCADGYRAHRVDGEQMANARTEVPGAIVSKHIVPDFLCLFPRETPYTFSVNTQALVSALYAVRPFARDASNIVRFEAQSDALVIRATSAEYGDAQVRVDGADYAPGASIPQEFALNCKYALEALSGMGERTEIATHSEYGQQAFVFTSEVRKVTRKALVMPMHMNR